VTSIVGYVTFRTLVAQRTFGDLPNPLAGVEHPEMELLPRCSAFRRQIIINTLNLQDEAQGLEKTVDRSCLDRNLEVGLGSDEVLPIDDIQDPPSDSHLVV